MDILTEKWYEGLPCFKLSPDYGIQPKPLGKFPIMNDFSLFTLILSGPRLDLKGLCFRRRK